jgi:CHAT domain-containing protein
MLSTSTNTYKISQDPLIRSGLILAGGNDSWLGKSKQPSNNDGILTAYEISKMDLSNTDLVVLSACETARGDIDASEGVFGLQRAFKLAGVDYIIMSLWNVPDKETSEFMQLFYSNWLGGMNIYPAFQKTQRDMIKRYRDEPKKWAGFILVY